MSQQLAGAFSEFIVLIQWTLRGMMSNSFLMFALAVPLILGLIAIIFSVFRRS